MKKGKRLFRAVARYGPFILFENSPLRFPIELRTEEERKKHGRRTVLLCVFLFFSVVLLVSSCLLLLFFCFNVKLVCLLNRIRIRDADESFYFCRFYDVRIWIRVCSKIIYSKMRLILAGGEAYEN